MRLNGADREHVVTASREKRGLAVRIPKQHDALSDPLQRATGPAPTASSQDLPWLRRRERILSVKNRMREICSASGSCASWAG